jgi:hypothetical protein
MITFIIIIELMKRNKHSNNVKFRRRGHPRTAWRKINDQSVSFKQLTDAVDREAILFELS